jgi:hypothetical protein
MPRGDVVTINITFPDGTTKPKHVIVLTEWSVPHHDTHGQAAVVVANTNKRKGRPIKPYEVELDTSHGFDHDTIVDGRWVRTIAMTDLEGGNYRTPLAIDTMNAIDRAVAEGLELRLK